MAHITILTDQTNALSFRLQPVHVSIANSIRRVLLSEIDMVVVISYPHDANNCHITINTSRFTNEFLKQRISSIPIHLNTEVAADNEGKEEEDDQDDEDASSQQIWQAYQIKCNKKNTSNQMIVITSEDLELVHKVSGEKLNKTLRDQVFPPDEHGYFIDILRLRPELANSIPGEEIEFTCDMSISNAKHNSMYNTVSKATYENTPDKEKALQVWSEIELTQKGKEDSTTTKENWFLLDAKRHFIPNSFDFTIETIGVSTNKQLLNLAVQKMIDKLTAITQNSDSPINESPSTIKNCYDVTLQNEDYTLGKVLEYLIYSMYFEGAELVTYVGFRKEHPHDDDSIIRIGFKAQTDKHLAREYLIRAAAQGIELYSDISKQIANL